MGVNEMKVNVKHDYKIIKMQITEAERLDLINVYFEDVEPGKGRIIIECYGEVWCSWWGAMSGRSVMEFVSDCNCDYIIGKMISKRPGSIEYKYLMRILTAVKEAIANESH